MHDPTPPIHTRVCDRFGITHPIVNAPVGGGDAPGELADALQAARAGVDVITAQGTEAGGLARSTPWPTDVSGRAIRDAFSDRWYGNEDELREIVRAEAHEARGRASVASDARGHWAGEAARFVTERELAADVVELLARDARAVLTERTTALIDP